MTTERLKTWGIVLFAAVDIVWIAVLLVWFAIFFFDPYFHGLSSQRIKASLIRVRQVDDVGSLKGDFQFRSISDRVTP